MAANEQDIWFSKASASKELKSFEPAFKKLKLVHELIMDRDAQNGWLYSFHSERPHVGHLTAAVWLSGGFGLEEYGTHKTNGGKFNRGRCDLRIGINKTVFECEAKSLWLNIGSEKEKFTPKIDNTIKYAEADVRKLKIKRGLALCFITPVVRDSKSKDLFMHRDEFIQSAKDNSCADALIWIGVKKGPKTEQILCGDFFYPGLLLAIKEVP